MNRGDKGKKREERKMVIKIPKIQTEKKL